MRGILAPRVGDSHPWAGLLSGECSNVRFGSRADFPLPTTHCRLCGGATYAPWSGASLGALRTTGQAGLKAVVFSSTHRVKAAEALRVTTECRRHATGA